MRSLIFFTLIALLAGCEVGETSTVQDQCMRQELFKQCMAALPKGPERVGSSNDWEEVVSACGTQSAYLSTRKRIFVKPECQAY